MKGGEVEKKSSNRSQKQALPQTGEKTTNILLILGMTIMIIIIPMIIEKKN